MSKNENLIYLNRTTCEKRPIKMLIISLKSLNLDWHHSRSGKPTSAPPSPPQSISAFSCWFSRRVVDSSLFLSRLLAQTWYLDLFYSLFLWGIAGYTKLRGGSLFHWRFDFRLCFQQNCRQKWPGHFHQSGRCLQAYLQLRSLAHPHVLDSISTWLYGCGFHWWAGSNQHGDFLVLSSQVWRE